MWNIFLEESTILDFSWNSETGWIWLLDLIKKKILPLTINLFPWAMFWHKDMFTPSYNVLWMLLFSKHCKPLKSISVLPCYHLLLFIWHIIWPKLCVLVNAENFEWERILVLGCNGDVLIKTIASACCFKHVLEF